MNVGIERIDIHEGRIVKALLDSGAMSQTSVTPSHNLLTIMCLTLHLFTETFTLKKNLYIYTLVLFIH